MVRPIAPEDAPGLQAGFRELTPEQVRFRFMRPMSELPDDLAAQLAASCAPREFALVAIEHGVASPRIGAVVRASTVGHAREAEFALTVGSPLGGLGLGTLLLRRLVQWARLKRLDAVYGDISHDNTAMLRVAEKLGFQRVHLPDSSGLIRARLDLRSA